MVRGEATRKSANRGKTPIITSSPYKDELQNKQAAANKGALPKAPKGKFKVADGLKGKNKRKGPSSATCSGVGTVGWRKEARPTGDEDVPCLYCHEMFSASLSRERWVKCSVCDDWAHVECAGVGNANNFICKLCDD